jgi:hypothetical protein
MLTVTHKDGFDSGVSFDRMEKKKRGEDSEVEVEVEVEAEGI